jgi:hypothetical protein
MGEESESDLKKELEELDEKIMDMVEEVGVDVTFIFTAKGERCYTLHNMEDADLIDLVLGVCTNNIAVSNAILSYLVMSKFSSIDKRKMDS